MAHEWYFKQTFQHTCCSTKIYSYLTALGEARKFIESCGMLNPLYLSNFLDKKSLLHRQSKNDNYTAQYK